MSRKKNLKLTKTGTSVLIGMLQDKSNSAFGGNGIEAYIKFDAIKIKEENEGMLIGFSWHGKIMMDMVCRKVNFKNGEALYIGNLEGRMPFSLQDDSRN